MNKKAKMSIWDYLVWVALIGIVIWLFLKIFGIVNTPLWFEYAPIYSAVYIAGWAVERLKRTTEDVSDIKKNLKYINKDMGKIKHSNCPGLSS